MAATAAFLGIAVAAALLQCAFGATITVGGPRGGWDQSTDLQTWAASQVLSAGDTLVFQYLPNHDVLEVSKADYDACRASSPIKSYTGGSANVDLPAPGKRYFICGTAGHCSQGMKLEVDVSAASAAATPTASPTPGATPAAEAPKISVEAPSTSPPSESTTSSPSPGGSTPQAAPSAAAGTKASVAAVGLASVLLGLLLAV